MIALPNPQSDEARVEIVEVIVDGMISRMTLEEMRKMVWDVIYEDLIWQEWPDLLMHAEEYAPEWLEER